MSDYQFPETDPDELTGGPAEGVGARFAQLHKLMAYLRSPEGCPWDREQDLFSLREYLLEESEELAEAIDALEEEPSEENYAEVIDELGDLLLQVLFEAQVLAEEGRGDITDVMENLRRKLVRRHPHVFGDEQAETPDDVKRTWDELKEEERSGDS